MILSLTLVEKAHLVPQMALCYKSVKLYILKKKKKVITIFFFFSSSRLYEVLINLGKLIKCLENESQCYLNYSYLSVNRRNS